VKNLLEHTNGNGNGNAKWLQWINTLLLLVVSGLISIVLSATEKRLSKLEEEMARQERVSKLEDEVRRIGMEQSSHKTTLQTIEGEIVRLRARAKE